MQKKVILRPVSFSYYSEKLTGIKTIIQFRMGDIDLNISIKDVILINNILVFQKEEIHNFKMKKNQQNHSLD